MDDSDAKKRQEQWRRAMASVVESFVQEDLKQPLTPSAAAALCACQEAFLSKLASEIELEGSSTDRRRRIDPKVVQSALERLGMTTVWERARSRVQPQQQQQQKKRKASRRKNHQFTDEELQQQELLLKASKQKVLDEKKSQRG